MSNAATPVLQHDQAALLERVNKLREVRQEERQDNVGAVEWKGAQQHSWPGIVRRNAVSSPVPP